MSLTKATYSMIEGASANVLDFGAVADGVTDDTAAFAAAMAANKNVWVPSGTYALNGLRILNGVNLIGAGKNATFFNQYSAATPAIDCTSDVTVGQLAGVRLANFAVNGHPSASVAAVRIYAAGVYAIWRSEFDFSAFNTYQAAYIAGPTANNVFNCDFKIQSQGTTNYAIELDGGVYNRFDLFLTDCESYAVYGNEGFNCRFVKLTCDGCVRLGGQNTVLINPNIENIYASVAPDTAAFRLIGFNQTLIEPTTTTNPASAAKLSYAFAPFAQTAIIAPNMIGTGSITNPFENTNNQWTLIGPVRSRCVNKIETIYDGSSNSRNLRRVSLIGDVSEVANSVTYQAGRTVQYLVPTGSFNFTVNPNTDSVIWEAAGTIALCNLNLDTVATPRANGTTISFYSLNAVTTINVSSPAGANVSLVPTTIAAGGKFTLLYDATRNKYYPIA